MPTKIVRKPDGKVEAVFDRLLALQTDAKLSGEMDGRQAVDNGALSLTFTMYGRNDKLAPRDWIDAEILPVTQEESLEQYAAPPDLTQPGLDDLQNGTVPATVVKRSK